MTSTQRIKPRSNSARRRLSLSYRLVKFSSRSRRNYIMYTRSKLHARYLRRLCGIVAVQIQIAKRETAECRARFHHYSLERIITGSGSSSQKGNQNATTSMERFVVFQSGKVERRSHTSREENRRRASASLSAGTAPGPSRGAAVFFVFGDSNKTVDRRRHAGCGRSRRTGLKMAYIIRPYR